MYQSFSLPAHMDTDLIIKRIPTPYTTVIPPFLEPSYEPSVPSSLSSATSTSSSSSSSNQTTDATNRTLPSNPALRTKRSSSFSFLSCGCSDYSTLRYLLVLLHLLGIYLYTTGFLLTRIEFAQLSSSRIIPGYHHIPLSIQRYLDPYHDTESSVATTTEEKSLSSTDTVEVPKLLSVNSSRSFSRTTSNNDNSNPTIRSGTDPSLQKSNGWSLPVYDRLVLIIIDAWRYDFAHWRDDLSRLPSSSKYSSRPSSTVNGTLSTIPPPLPSLHTVTSASSTLPPYINAMPLLAQRLANDNDRASSAFSSPSSFSSSSSSSYSSSSSFAAADSADSSSVQFRYTSLLPVTVDAPTVTMQRIKGITAGNLPTFIDISNNFASTAINEDNLIQQFAQASKQRRRNGNRSRSSTGSTPASIPSTNDRTGVPKKQIHFMGDDTWMDLFPHIFPASSASSSPFIYNTQNQAYPYPSFNVKDLHTVDNGIIHHLFSRYLVPTMDNSNRPQDNDSPSSRLRTITTTIEYLQRYEKDEKGQYNTTEELLTLLSSPSNTSTMGAMTTKDDWDLLIGHFLGVDHVGHRYGPLHPSIRDKLDQMDQVLQTIVDRLTEEEEEPTDNQSTTPTTLLVVLGDHGMTEQGNHGGSSNEEIYSALYLHSFGRPLTYDITHTSYRSTDTETIVPSSVPLSQIDLVPTLALALGIPIPYGSLGTLFPQWIWSIDSFLPHRSNDESWTNILYLLYQEVIHLIINYEQVHRYLASYATLSKSFNLTYIRTLENDYESILAKYYGILRTVVTNEILPSLTLGNDTTTEKETSESTESLLRGKPYRHPSANITKGSFIDASLPFSRTEILNMFDTWCRNLTVHDTHRLLHRYPSLPQEFQSIQGSLRSLLSLYASLCRNLWTQFDTDSMIQGMVILGCGLGILLHSVYSTVTIDSRKKDTKGTNDRILYVGNMSYYDEGKGSDTFVSSTDEDASSSSSSSTNTLRQRKKATVPPTTTNPSRTEDSVATKDLPIMDQYLIQSSLQSGTVTVTIQNTLTIPSSSLTVCLGLALGVTLLYTLGTQPVYTVSTILSYTEMIVDYLSTFFPSSILVYGKTYLHDLSSFFLVRYPIERTLLYFCLPMPYHTLFPFVYGLTIDKPVPLSLLIGIGSTLGYTLFVLLQYRQETVVLRHLFPSISRSLFDTFRCCGRCSYSRYVSMLPSPSGYASVTGVSFTSGSIFLLLVLRLWSLFTNSFIVTEDQVTIYFVIVTLLLLTLRTVYRINEIMVRRKIYTVPSLMYTVLGLVFIGLLCIRVTNIKSSYGIIHVLYRSKTTVDRHPTLTRTAATMNGTSTPIPTSDTTDTSFLSFFDSFRTFLTNYWNTLPIEELYVIEPNEQNGLLPMEAVETNDIAATSTGLGLCLFPLMILGIWGYGLPYVMKIMEEVQYPKSVAVSSSVDSSVVYPRSWLLLLTVVAFVSNSGVYLYWYQQVYSSLPSFLSFFFTKDIPYRLWGPRIVYFFTFGSIGWVGKWWRKRTQSCPLASPRSSDSTVIPSSSSPFIHRYQSLLLLSLSTYPSLCLLHGPWSPFLLGSLYCLLFSVGLLLYILYGLESYVKQENYRHNYERSINALSKAVNDNQYKNPTLSSSSSSITFHLTFDTQNGTVYTSSSSSSSSLPSSPSLVLHYPFFSASWFWIFRLVQSLFTEIYHIPPILTMFIGMHFFHATGHAHQFSALAYNSAFIGIEHFSFLLSGTLLFTNTFGLSHLVGFSGLAYLVPVLPSLHSSSFLPSFSFSCSETKEKAASASLFLRTYHRLLSSWYATASDPVTRTSIHEGSKRRLLLCAGSSLILFCTCIFCFIVRRELMVWAIFAPKYCFESISLLVTETLLLLMR